MTGSNKKAPLEVLAPLGGLLALTFLAIGILILRNRPAVVEMKIAASQVAFEVIPPLGVDSGETGPALGGAPPVLRKLSLFEPSLAVQAVELRDIDCLEATLGEAGPVSIRPGLGGSIRLRASEAFTPELILMEPTRVTLKATGRGRIQIGLDQEAPMTQPRLRKPAPPPGTSGGCAERTDELGGWNGRIPIQPEMSLRLQNVSAPGPGAREVTALSESGTFAIPNDALDIAIAGDRHKSWMSLALPPEETASTRILVLDPASGEIVSDHRLPEALSEARTVSWGERLVFVEPSLAQVRPRPLLRSNLKIRDLDLMRPVLLETYSSLLGGTVRFPAGEKEPIELEPGFFLDLAVPPDRPLTLRSIDMVDGRLEMVLWGEPESFKIGPTQELQSERLPSYLEWLYTHRLGGLIYGTLGWVAGAVLALLKLLGDLPRLRPEEKRP